MNNYEILKQRLQQYIASLANEAKSDKEIAAKNNCVSLHLMGERKNKIAQDLSDIIQSMN